MEGGEWGDRAQRVKSTDKNGRGRETRMTEKSVSERRERERERDRYRVCLHEINPQVQFLACSHAAPGRRIACSSPFQNPKSINHKPRARQPAPAPAPRVTRARRRAEPEKREPKTRFYRVRRASRCRPRLPAHSQSHIRTDPARTPRSARAAPASLHRIHARATRHRLRRRRRGGGPPQSPPQWLLRRPSAHRVRAASRPAARGLLTSWLA